MKTFFNILAGIFGAALMAALVWGLLYLTIPGVKDNTDKLFKWNEQIESETETETETDITAHITFENENIKIII